MHSISSHMFTPDVALCNPVHVHVWRLDMYMSMYDNTVIIITCRQIVDYDGLVFQW